MTKSAHICIAVAVIGVVVLNVAEYGVIGVFGGVFDVAFVYAVYFFGTHLRRSPTPETMRRLQTLSFHTRMPPAQAVRAVAAFARPNGYRVKQQDEANGWILLSQPMSVRSPALYYPVQVASSPYPGWLRVDVGVRFMGYPGLLRSDLAWPLQSCADSVERALTTHTEANAATA